MVLILLADAREIADDLDAELVEHLGVADARALEDLGRAERARAEDDHLARLHDRLDDLRVVRAVARGNVRDTDGLVVCVEDDARSARVAAEVEVALHVHDTVDVGCVVDMSEHVVEDDRKDVPVAASLRRPV